MRTWGRDNAGKWQMITDPNLISVTTLAQVLRLEKGEDPRFGNYGIGAINAIQNRTPPDIDMASTIQQFQSQFQSLTYQNIGVTAANVLQYSVRAQLFNGQVFDLATNIPT